MWLDFELNNTNVMQINRNHEKNGILNRVIGLKKNEVVLDGNSSWAWDEHSNEIKWNWNWS